MQDFQGNLLVCVTQACIILFMRLYPGDFLLFHKIDSVSRGSSTCATYDYWINFILTNPIRRVGGGGLILTLSMLRLLSSKAQECKYL